MTRPTWSRALVLVLLLVLATPPAFAAGGRAVAEPSVRGVLSVLWQAVAKLLTVTQQGSGTRPLEGGSGGDSGPGMDPNG